MSRYADYTLWLVVFTSALAVVSAIQIYFLNRADKTARISADAAKTAANAANRQATYMVEIELPIFIIEDVSTVGYTSTPSIQIKIGNHGRTPAIITADCFEIKIAKLLPNKPVYSPDATFPILRDRVVEPHHTYSLSRKNSLSDDELDSILKGQAILWIYGYVDYLDFMKREHREGYCIAFFPARLTSAEKIYLTMPPTSLSWARSGPSSYTYTRRKTEEDRRQHLSEPA